MDGSIRPLRFPAVCAHASPAVSRRCFARFRELRQRLSYSVLADADAFIAGAEWYAKRDLEPQSLSAHRGTATVSGFADVQYPNTSFSPHDPTFPLTTAYGWGNSGFCKVESWGVSGSSTNVRTKCFTATGTPTTSLFTQSFMAATFPGPC